MAANNAAGAASMFARQEHRAGGVKDAQVYPPGVQVDAAVMLVLLGIEIASAAPFPARERVT